MADTQQVDLATKHEQLKRLYEQCAEQREYWYTRARTLDACLEDISDEAHATLAELGECPDYETAMAAASKLVGTLHFIESHADRTRRPDGTGD